MRIEHASKTGWRTPDHTTTEFAVYECDYCDEEFTHTADSISSRDRMKNQIEDHMKEEHPDMYGRNTYPNEDIFREWGDKIGADVFDPIEDGDPVVAKIGAGKKVKLFENGEIILSQFAHLGNAQADDATVAIEGQRLVVSRNDDKQYVSLSAFPIDQ